MKRVAGIIAVVLLLWASLGSVAHAGGFWCSFALDGGDCTSVWLGNATVTKAAAEVKGRIARLDALFTAFHRSSKIENITGRIEVASDELGESLESLNKAVSEEFDNMTTEEQESLQSAFTILVNDGLLPLAEKGDAALGEGTFSVGDIQYREGIPYLLWSSSISFD